MMQKIPVGIEDFKEMMEGNFYYIDKTDFIADTFNEKVALYTRPRRFGKTLNMSMLYYFYSIKDKKSASLFEQLKISENSESKKFQNQYPVISITLKGMTDPTFDLAFRRFSSLIRNLIRKFPELLTSENLDEDDKALLKNLKKGCLDYIQLSESLYFLSECLYQHYGRKVILLIDEYDVPLNYAYENGYYNEMIQFMRSVLSQSLKTNSSLEKAILTGCLRISKESIFTGLNNFSVCSLTSSESSSAFGFTQKEVNQLFSNFGFSDKLGLVKEWYDGYQFGPAEIYNPWSTLNYLKKLINDSQALPESYWANTSSNSIVFKYIQNSGTVLRAEFERLVQGHTVMKPIKPDLTFRELEDPQNIYSFLLLTGYLKSIRQLPENQHELKIPNQEVRQIYQNHFNDYFNSIKTGMQSVLFSALCAGNETGAEKYLNDLLFHSVSFFDNAESFYHGFLVGVLSDYGFSVVSNREAGDGRFDLLLRSEMNDDDLILIECKHSKTKMDMEADAVQGVKQIKRMRYLEDPSFASFNNKQGFGIAFHKKMCSVKAL